MSSYFKAVIIFLIWFIYFVGWLVGILSPGIGMLILIVLSLYILFED